jgi:small neutral amino acid transporter SnatA (MarC family)
VSGLIGGPPGLWLGVAVVLAAAAPFHRARLAGPFGGAPGRLVAAAALAAAALAGVAGAAAPARDLLGTSDPALRTAAGLVLTVTAAAHVLRPRPRPVDLRGRGGTAGMVFPVLVRPETVLAVASLSADHGAVPAAASAAAAMALTGAVLWGRPAWRPSPGDAPRRFTDRGSNETVRLWATASVGVGVLAVFSGVLSV